MIWPDQPEYLQLFSNEGLVKVSVQFSDKCDKHRSMTEMSMHWHELDRLIDPETGSPYNYIYFNTYKCQIKRYEIDPVKNSLTIVIAKTDLP